MKKFSTRLCFTLTALSISTHAFASDFNIPFYNAADLGNLYSGWAASSNDASATYSNPAGLTQLKGQQLVVSALGLKGTSEYNGSATPPFPTQSGSASTNLSGLIPSLYYAIPLSSRVVFAIGQAVPFGLGTNYSKDSLVRYLATRTQIVVGDVVPSLGIQVNDQISVGIGLDAQRMALTVDSAYGPPLSVPDSQVQSHLTGWGFGWHGGIQYQVVPKTRLGVSYHSQSMFHLTGDSEVFNPDGAELRTTNQRSYFAMPGRAELSIHQDITSCWALMATAFYTHWSELQKITLRHTMTPFGTTIPTSVPFGYHDTFDYSIGTDFKPTEKWVLKAGIEFWQTPTNNRDRLISDPLGTATILAVGAHYQQNHCLGYDLGYAHAFWRQMPIHTTTPISSLNGHSNSNSNVFGGQLTWNI